MEALEANLHAWGLEALTFRPNKYVQYESVIAKAQNRTYVWGANEGGSGPVDSEKKLSLTESERVPIRGRWGREWWAKGDEWRGGALS